MRFKFLTTLKHFKCKCSFQLGERIFTKDMKIVARNSSEAIDEFVDLIVDTLIVNRILLDKTYFRMLTVTVQEMR